MKVRKSVELESDNVDWLYATYPEVNISTLLDTLLQYYREATEKTPEEYKRIAVERFKNGIVPTEG